MSVLGNQTNITTNDYFFLRANVSTLVVNSVQANSIQTSTLTAFDGKFSTIEALTVSTGYTFADSISSQRLEANLTEFSSIFGLQGLISSFTTNNIVLDGNFIDTGGAGFGAVLLLNGLPIATGTSSLSSIQDWSFFPALSTLQMGGYNISNAGNITSQNIFNALNVQSDTFTGLTSVTAPAGTITNLRTTNLSSVQINTSNLFVQSNVQTNTLTGNRVTVSGVSSLSISTGTINGLVPISGSNWSFYPAQTTVQLAGNNINTTGALSVTGSNTMSFTTPNGNLLSNFDISLTGGGVNMTADEGGRIDLFSDINLTAQNGNRGRINLTANGGFNNGVFGEVNLVANGGSLSGVGTGGLITLTANTPTGFSNLTSAIKFSAAGIDSYAGAVPPIGSLAGYNFIFGNVGVNICAGLPSIFPNIPGTTYIYGTNGVSLDGINTVEVKATLGFESGNDNYFNAIYPFWGGLSTPPDLLIAGRYIIPNLAQVCVNLSNVRNIYFQSNVATTLQNCDSITMTANGSISSSNIGTTNINTSFINGTPIASYLNTNLFQTASISSATISSINGIGVSNLINQTVSTFQTASISSATISSINGIGLSNLINQTVSTFQTASISSLTVSSMNNFASFNIDSNAQGLILQGNLPLLQLKNTDPGGQLTTVNLFAVDNYMRMECYNSNNSPLNMFFDADNFGFNVPTVTGGIEFDISGNTQVRGDLTVTNLVDSSVLTPYNLSVSSITNLRTINGKDIYTFGEFITTSNVTVTNSNTPTVIPFTTNTVGNQVALSGGEIQVLQAGLYKYSVSIQMDKTGAGIDACDFWVRINGNDVADTGSQITVQGNTGETLANCSYYLTLNANDTVVSVFASAENTMTARYFPAWVTPGDPYDRPAIPAVIASIELLR